jgi:hypothetical protein
MISLDHSASFRYLPLGGTCMPLYVEDHKTVKQLNLFLAVFVFRIF